jgi:L-malate glycosyltransferase
MNVLILPSWYPRFDGDSYGSFFKEQAIALKNAGHNVIVFDVTLTPVSCSTGSSEIKLNQYSDAGVQVYQLCAPELSPCNTEPFFDESIGFYYDYLYKILMNEGKKIDIIHAHATAHGGFGGVQISKKYKIPFVVTEHSSGYISNPNDSQSFKMLEYTVNNSDCFIFVSSEYKKYIQSKIHCTKDNLAVIPNMVDTTIFNNNVIENDSNTFKILTIANLVEIKHIDIIMKAFDKAFDKTNNVTLTIVGDGDKKEELIDYAKTLKSKDRIFFTGKLPRHEIPLILSRCNVFALTSKYETFGIVYIESLAAGKPIIAAKNGGPLDIVTDINGLLVDFGDIDQLAKAMQSIYANYSKYDSEMIKLDCEKRFSQQSVVKMINDVYERVLNNY